MTRPLAFRATLRSGAAVAGVLVTSCAINPVSGKSELALVPESQEIAMGKQGSAEVVQSIGLYPDAGVQTYVSRLGLSLAANSERPQLAWEYHVLDDPSVNAFALPGGYIFVTRGLLTHLTNEAELVSVLGHETGHVTARHSVRQISQAQLAQLGLGIGSMLSSGIREYSGVAGAGLGLLFLKFSRDDETQADQLGFRYALTDGYDVREMIGVFQMLDQQSKMSGGGRLPEWQATHPDPGNRIKATEQRVAALQQEDFSNKRVGEEAFLKVTDGMVYGENPRLGFFRGSLFMHPDLRFLFRFPDGWKTQNRSDAVLGASPAQDAVIVLRLASGTAAEAARAFFSQEGLQAGTVSQNQIHGFPARSGQFSAETEQGVVRGIATFIEYGGTTYQITAYTAGDKFSRYGSALERSSLSFDRLTDPDALAVQPMRLRLTRAPRAMSLTQFNSQYSSSVSLDELALINGIGKAGQLRSGQMVKRVVPGSSPR